MSASSTASSKKRSPKRLGAFLRLYGPKAAPTHAVLVLGNDRREDTPEAFYRELEGEKDLNYRAAQHGFGLFWQLRFSRADY
jgi:hypothetical protein